MENLIVKKYRGIVWVFTPGFVHVLYIGAVYLALFTLLITSPESDLSINHPIEPKVWLTLIRIPHRIMATLSQ